MKRYAVLLLAALAIVCNELVARAAPPAPWRDLLGFLSMLACTVACGLLLRQQRRLDELARRIQLEASGFAFGGAALLSFGYGFLEGLAYPRLSMLWVWPVMGVLWVVGGLLARRRYA
jgi:hypothetical protein